MLRCNGGLREEGGGRREEGRGLRDGNATYGDILPGEDLPGLMLGKTVWRGNVGIPLPIRAEEGVPRVSPRPIPPLALTSPRPL